jgi:hypothetical protein
VFSPRGTYATPEMVALERDNLNFIAAGQGQTRALANADEIGAWVKALTD